MTTTETSNKTNLPGVRAAVAETCSFCSLPIAGGRCGRRGRIVACRNCAVMERPGLAADAVLSGADAKPEFATVGAGLMEQVFFRRVKVLETGEAVAP